MARRKRPRPPRVVLLETRQLANLETLARSLLVTAEKLASLHSVLLDLATATPFLVLMADKWNADKERRSDAARRANATRRAAAPVEGVDGITLPPCDEGNPG